ncbi:MAG: (Fe-S)-binding protein [Burkholderiales bacterium]
MTAREGNLEAPTRHALQWLDDSFYDEAKLNAELERVFDICHGCRRCVSLCNAFPTLFDLIDAGQSGEVDGVDKKSFGKVVDQCYLCDLCYMTKCPYVPPHAWNVDFPHLMLRAKALKFRNGEVPARDKILSSTDKLGFFAGIPIVTKTVNAVNSQPAARAVMEKVLGVDRKAWVPQFAERKFGSKASENAALTPRDGERTPGKVAVFATCFINYNEPQIGYDLLKILDHNEIPYVLAEKQACCGMPKLELGDLESVDRLKKINIPTLAALARAGYAILTPIPSCTLMFKQELPLMYPGDEDVEAVRAAMFDPFEYLVARDKDGLLKSDFTVELGKVSYHVPCHGRVQKIGRKTEEMLKMIPGIQLITVERCSGHAGTWGVKKAFHAEAMKIGRPVFKAMGAPNPDYISSDCQLAGHHIEQGMRENEIPSSAKLAHPLTLVRIAYGL